MLDKDNSWYCNKCKQFVQALKKIEIFKANKILMLGFKRFRLGRKLKCRINFPVNGLDMGPFIISKLLIELRQLQ
jgi:ubiquitin C-terminal hydrolase